MPSITKPSGTVIQNKHVVMPSVNPEYLHETLRRHEELSEAKINKQIEITKATIIAQENERNEIGKELNENISQTLATVKLYLETSLLSEDLDKDLVKRGHGLLTNCIDELRRITKSLAPPSLNELTLEEIVDEMLNSLRKSVEDVRLELVNFDESLLPKDLKVSIYRIIQEQVSNILKYANASRVVISINHETDYLAIVVSDNGNGFDTHVQRKGAGITSIINRAQLFRGDVIIRSAPGEGCVIAVHFVL